MKKIIQLEALVPFLLSIIIVNTLPVSFSWWAWILLFISPDLGMVGYLVNDKVGAIMHNIFHHQLLAAIVVCAGLLLHQPYVALAGLVLLGRSSIDRVFGYGLKLNMGFKFTHLGTIAEK